MKNLNIKDYIKFLKRKELTMCTVKYPDGRTFDRNIYRVLNNGELRLGDGTIHTGVPDDILCVWDGEKIMFHDEKSQSCFEKYVKTRGSLSFSIIFETK